MRVCRTITLVLATLATLPLCAFGQVTAGTVGDHSKPRQVLLLHSFDATFDVISSGFRIELARESPVPIEFVDVWLPPGRLNTKQQGQSIVEDLQAKYAGHKFDLIVALNGPAVVFAQEYRQQLFPTAPLLMGGVDRRFVRDATLTANDTAIPVSFNPPQTIEQILRLRPQTTHVFVVLGASELERFWRSELDREFQRFTGRLTFVWSDDLSFQDLLKRAATLPLNSAIFYMVWSIDRDGMTVTQDRALIDLHAAANAPIFGIGGSQVGQGVVGGLVGSNDLFVRNTAAVAVRILRGESLRGVISQTVPSEYDWRELRHWNISEDRLPPGSVVLFRPVTLWQQYRWLILGGVAVSIGEAVLILGLFVNRAKRRRAEGSLRISEARFRLVANSAPVMIWLAGCDKLATYVNDSWLKFTGRSMDKELGNGWTEGVHPEDIDRCRMTVTRAFDRRERFQNEFRLRRSDGAFRSILAVGVPIFTPQGAFSGYIGSALDVTDQQVAERALAGLSRKLIKAQEEERTFVARELHDDINQQLAILANELDLILRNHQLGERAEEEVALVVEHARDISASVQHLSHRLHPGHLQLLGLVRAIERLRSEFSRQPPTVGFVHRDVPRTIDHDVSLCLYRVVQEGLSNAVKHSEAAHVWMSLTGGPAGLELTITDDGRGFDQGSLSSQGLGLISMRERLEAVGGVLEIQSTPESGTCLRAAVPMRAPATVVSSATMSGDLNVANHPARTSEI
jgi:PAS domain S-box-containing protein